MRRFKFKISYFLNLKQPPFYISKAHTIYFNLYSNINIRLFSSIFLNGQLNIHVHQKPPATKYNTLAEP